MRVPDLALAAVALDRRHRQLAHRHLDSMPQAERAVLLLVARPDEVRHRPASAAVPGHVVAPLAVRPVQEHPVGPAALDPVRLGSFSIRPIG